MEHVTVVGAWDRELGGPDDGTEFACEVLPGLRHVPLLVMAEATGLPEAHCSFVRRGQKAQHRRH